MKEFYEIDGEIPQQSTYICNWGNRHTTHAREGCECWTKSGMSYLTMWGYIKEKWDIHYPEQITPEMKKYAYERKLQESKV